jgi:hypothetical protein
LINLIINVYFPFYQYTPPHKSRPDPTLLYNLEKGFNLWTRDLVSELTVDNVAPNIVGTLQSGYSVQDHPHDHGSGVAPTEAPRAYACGYKKAGSKEWCECGGHRLTGKRCVHLWAMRCAQTMGTVRTFEAESSAIAAYFPKPVDTRKAVDESAEDEGEEGLYELETAYWGEDFRVLGNPLVDFEFWQSKHGSSRPETQAWMRVKDHLGNADQGADGEKDDGPSGQPMPMPTARPPSTNPARPGSSSSTIPGCRAARRRTPYRQTRSPRTSARDATAAALPQ